MRPRRLLLIGKLWHSMRRELVGKGNFCAKHAMDGMVDAVQQNVHSRRLFEVAVIRRRRQPKARALCRTCCGGGGRRVERKCAYPACSTFLSFSVAGTKKRKLCAQHATAKMVSVKRVGSAVEPSKSAVVMLRHFLPRGL